MRFKKAAAIFTAAEGARQWARSNPDQARGYIDKATGFIDERTGGKYSSKISGISAKAKKNLTGGEASGSAQAPPPPPSSSPRPDLRA